MTQSITYEGGLTGLVRSGDQDQCQWEFEARAFDTPATESDVQGTFCDAMAEPTGQQVDKARAFVFGAGETAYTYTATALNSMAFAYAEETDGGDGTDPVVAILREAARRIAIIEALTS